MGHDYSIYASKYPMKYMGIKGTKYPDWDITFDTNSKDEFYAKLKELQENSYEIIDCKIRTCNGGEK